MPRFFPLEVLTNQLEAALAKACDVSRSRAQHMEDAGRLLHVLGNAGGLSHLIRQTLSSEEALKEVANRSSKHENGFTKIRVLKHQAIAVRLHVWDATRAGHWSGNIHDHRFSFCSYVVSGVLWQRNWRQVVSGEKYSRFWYFPGQKTGEHALKYDREATIVSDEITKIPTGTTYFFPAGALHQTRVGNVVRTVTLLVEDRLFLRPYAIVYSRRYPSNDLNVSSHMLDATECRALMEEVLEILS